MPPGHTAEARPVLIALTYPMRRPRANRSEGAYRPVAPIITAIIQNSTTYIDRIG